MKQKHLYTAPEAETLVVRFEANILSYGDPGKPGGGVSNGGSFDFGDDD